MIQDLLIYLLFGTLWSMLNEGVFSPKPFTNRKRISLILFWPITFGVFVIGFIIGWINHNFKE